MFIRKSEKKGIITLGILTMALFVLPRTIHKSEYPVFLIPYSRLSDTTQTVSPKPLVIELNSADSTALVSIRGIGPYYASKILRYREQLGGFHATRQLKEIKFQYLNIDSLLPHFSVNPALIRKKELDTMSFKNVLHHPYLVYEDVQLIFNAKRKFVRLTILPWNPKIFYHYLNSKK